MTGLGLPVLYAAFAGLAILANLLGQAVIFSLLVSPLAIYIAMPVGAIVGLGVKYALDRRYIFRPAHPASKPEFFRYAATGAGLTGIFFMAEFCCWALTGSALWRDLGAAAGLSLGYFAKYHMDKRLVFARPEAAQPLTQGLSHEHT